MDTLDSINSDIVVCRQCPRLVVWRELVAFEKRKSFEDWTYWGKAVPAFGDPDATHLIVGLAPAAHGANRTGRMFTGDRSGDWLFRALFKAGAASQPHSESILDGLVLRGVLITASCHCAPPDNKPTTQELDTCRQYLRRVLGMRSWSSILCLGGIAWNNVLRTLGETGRPKFGHGAVYKSVSGPLLVGSYHPSQQNTFTGRLTEEMLDAAIGAFLGG
ncbi:MAG TPA: uracil-DNA glycosylase [Fimbriimonadaceae bacterium]